MTHAKGLNSEIAPVSSLENVPVSLKRFCSLTLSFSVTLNLKERFLKHQEILRGSQPGRNKVGNLSLKLTHSPS